MSHGLLDRIIRGIVPFVVELCEWRTPFSASLARTLEAESGSALGRTMTVGDRRYDVAAVMPAGFGFPSADVDVWLSEPPAAVGAQVDAAGSRLEIG